MMRVPLRKNLQKHFRHLTAKQANLIRRLAHAVDDRGKLEPLIERECPETWRYARSCHNDPFDTGMWRRTMALHAIDRILGTYGVEALGPVSMREGPPYEYMNAGDPYVTTLIYRRDTDNLFIGSWGPIAERHPSW